MLNSRELYLGLIGLIVLERLVELILTSRNARALRRRGGVVVGAWK